MLQASMAANNAPTHSYTSLLKGVEAEARLVPVEAVCSMDAHFYSEHRTRPGICSIQLKARKATMEDLDAFPARLALADAMKNILWVAENYDALEREFPNHPWNAVMTVETGLDVPQQLLDRMVASLYMRSISVQPDTVEALLHIADTLQVQAVMSAVAEYVKVDMIPKHPAACHELGTHIYPQLELEEAVLSFFAKLQWDGAISSAMLQSIGTVLERVSDDRAQQFVRSLTEPPTLISPLQAASMSAQLPAQQREKLLQSLRIENLSMADVQSLLHWANNRYCELRFQLMLQTKSRIRTGCRRANRAVLADSPILWALLFNNVASSLLPLDHLTRAVGPKAGQMKLWDLPVAHVTAQPGRYRTRRSGWMHLEGGRSFCMEAVYTKSAAGAEWGLFCNPDRQHAFLPHYIIKLCAIQQGRMDPYVELSPDIQPTDEQKPGLGMGFDELLSKWANSPQLVWEKHGQAYLTLGLYVDLNEGGRVSCKAELPMAEDPAFVLPGLVRTADIFAGVGDLAVSDSEAEGSGHNRQMADETAAAKLMNGRASRVPTASGSEEAVTSFRRPGRGAAGHFRDVSPQGKRAGIGRNGPPPDKMPYAIIRRELEA